jgi:membrane dipeptidase
MYSRSANRREFLGAALAGAGVLVLPGCVTTKTAAPVRHPLLEKYVSIDSHTHPGALYKGGGFPARALSDFKDSQLTALVFSIPTDIPVMGKNRKITREASQGELYEYSFDQLRTARGALESAGISIVGSPDEVRALKANGGHGAILAIEGGDFAEGDLGKIDEAYELGVRVIQPGHYRLNAFTDIQTSSPKHGGLSAEGEKFIARMNHLGIMVDTAHMSLDAVIRAAEVSTTPLILSHTLIGDTVRPGGRTIDANHARKIANTSGAVGVWSVSHPNIPSDYGYFIDQFKYLSNATSVGNVMLGTDLNSTEGWIKDYAGLPKLVDGLLGAGFPEDEVGMIIGGNFMRIFDQVTAKKS